MKFKTYALSFLALVMSVTAAEAATYQAPLVRFHMDDALDIHESKVDSGEVLVKLEEKKVSLTLLGRNNCPPGAYCIMMVPTVLKVELPIVSSQKDSCGITTIIAETEAKIPGSKIERVEIRDNSKNKCPHIIGLAATEVIYETAQAVKSEKAKTRSKFEGERLEKVKY